MNCISVRAVYFYAQNRSVYRDIDKKILDKELFNK